MEAVRDLLRRLPAAGVTPVAELRRTDHGPQADALIRVHYGGAVRLLVIEVKAHGAPRFVRSAVYELESYVARISQSPAHAAEQVVPMLACPYLSPESRAICRDHDVAYLDLEGNVRLVFDGYIERSVPTKPKSETRTLRSVFTPKASAILRALLREPDRPWLVTDLAASAHASLGHVSNVCKALLEREWVARRPDGIVLTQPDALIQTWRENYRRPGGDRFDAYTHLHGRQFDDLARKALNARPGSPRAVYALASAVQWIAPFTRDATRSFYTDAAGARVLREKLDVRPASTDPNVVVHAIADESIFDDAIEPLPGLFCTCPIVTYLDLWCGNDREREAAAHLARQTLPWIA
ncbi:MAG: hypothetical protein OXH68_20670 [Gammaproteobacteria bacterium]|nr:hypothetical protein [Gammaproteobacteria bacterium]